MAERIGFIGLGAMGGPMVDNLLKAGYEVVVTDVRPEVVEAAVAKGAKGAASPKAIADEVETVLICLPTPDIVRAVATGKDGLIHGKAIKTFVDLSTTGPTVAQEVAEALSGAGITPLDSPVSGGVQGAIDGTLAVMVSGPHNKYGDLRPMLEKIGKNTFYVGDKPGMGQMMKLVNNMMSAAYQAIACECVALGAKYGLDPKIMIDVVNAGSGMSTATTQKFPKSILPRTWKYGFKTGLQYKDVRLALEAADKMGVPMFVGGATKQLWAYALEKGGFDSDISELMKRVEELANVTVPKVG
ncbi:MAG: NAD(P)-dependent oxidoreductase [Alphaproteobacteria bacterium]